MHLKEPEWEGMYWIDLGQDRNKYQVLMNMVIKLGSIKGGEILDKL
jgi:hypothetical protein